MLFTFWYCKSWCWVTFEGSGVAHCADCRSLVLRFPSSVFVIYLQHCFKSFGICHSLLWWSSTRMYVWDAWCIEKPLYTVLVRFFFTCVAGIFWWLFSILPKYWLTDVSWVSDFQLSPLHQQKYSSWLPLALCHSVHLTKGKILYPPTVPLRLWSDSLWRQSDSSLCPRCSDPSRTRILPWRYQRAPCQCCRTETSRKVARQSYKRAIFRASEHVRKHVSTPVAVRKTTPRNSPNMLLL